MLFCTLVTISIILLNTHTGTHVHTHTHLHTVSMETETRAFYDWLFAQDNQKWSRQPCKDGRYIICIMSNGTYTNEENKMFVVAWRSLVTKFDHEIVIEYKLSIKPSFSVCLGWRQTSRLFFFFCYVLRLHVMRLNRRGTATNVDSICNNHTQAQIWEQTHTYGHFPLMLPFSCLMCVWGADG